MGRDLDKVTLVKFAILLVPFGLVALAGWTLYEKLLKQKLQK